jgi:hypothetical protein
MPRTRRTGSDETARRRVRCAGNPATGRWQSAPRDEFSACRRSKTPGRSPIAPTASRVIDGAWALHPGSGPAQQRHPGLTGRGNGQRRWYLQVECRAGPEADAFFMVTTTANLNGVPAIPGRCPNLFSRTDGACRRTAGRCLTGCRNLPPLIAPADQTTGALGDADCRSNGRL